MVLIQNFHNKGKVTTIEGKVTAIKGNYTMNVVNNDSQGPTEGGQVAHKMERPKSTTHTSVLSDGTKVIHTKKKRNLPDGSLLTKKRTETFAAPVEADAPTTHVIKTKTKRINDGGISFTTTTKEVSSENPPVTYTRVMPDGSRIIKTKTVTAGPVITTTTIHLKNIPPSTPMKNVEEGVCSDGQILLLKTKLSDNKPDLGHNCDDDEPMPPQYPVTLDECDENESHDKTVTVEEIKDEEPESLDNADDLEQLESLDGCQGSESHQKTVLVEEIKDEESPEPLYDTEDPTISVNRIMAAIQSRKSRVAPMPVPVDRGVSAPENNQLEERDSRVEVQNAQPSEYDEEVLAVARPVDRSDEEGPIYEATEYTPQPKTPFYKRPRCIFWTAVALVVITIVVAVTVVYATKEAVLPQPPPPLPEHDPYGLEPFIEANVLQRNFTWDSIGTNNPRRLAMDWILYEDKRQLKSLDDKLLQRYILALLAFSFDSLGWIVCGNHTAQGDPREDYIVESCMVRDVNGQENKSSVWLSSAFECDWYGVICIDDAVAGLDISYNGLIGTIPAEISKLNLTVLSLKENCIFGTIPPELGSMESLKQLELEYNGLSGTFPHQMTDNLEKINLAGQYWNDRECTGSDGSVVNTLFVRGVEANGENPGLTGRILGPQIGQLTSLKEITVHDNSFSGSIASDIGNLKQLAALNAGANLFTGTIPNQITYLSSLRELTLDSNEEIFGTIPSEIGNMKSLETLLLNTLSMGGEIPDSLYDLSNLKVFMIRDNNFEGSIKTEIGKLDKLTKLVLSSNPLTGTLPSELGLCENLEFLHLSNTQIQGTVPQQVCNLREKKLNSDNPFEEFFKADCTPNNVTLEPFFTCDCCQVCCDHVTKKCIMET